jgi:hypothetical protein
MQTGPRKAGFLAVGFAGWGKAVHNLVMLRLKLCPLCVAGLMLIAFLPAHASKEFSPPRAQPARMYPAHDDHPQEQVTVAIDPYDQGSKVSLFRTRWRESDFLPVRLIISNDGDAPITLTRMKVVLITAKKVKLEPASNDELYRRLMRTRSRGDEPSRNPTPVPLPRRGPQVGISKESRQEVEAAQFRAVAVEPHAMQSGFLFFDVQGIKDPLPGSSLYVTGIRDGNGQELMYFEISLDKYLAAPAGAGGGTMAQKP